MRVEKEEVLNVNPEIVNHEPEHWERDAFV